MSSTSKSDFTFGHIPPHWNGSRFKDRESLSKARVHCPPQAGIHGREKEGAVSIVVAGRYEDDDDHGYELTYTGSGGRTPNTISGRGKPSWSTHQTQDQEFTRANLALQISCDDERPVRVIRGHHADNVWSPSEGFRYDGLYNVVKYWREPGGKGFLVCRFKLVRLPGQSHIPRRDNMTGFPMSNDSDTDMTPAPKSSSSAKRQRRESVDSEYDHHFNKKIKGTAVKRPPTRLEGSNISLPRTSASTKSKKSHTTICDQDFQDIPGVK